MNISIQPMDKWPGAQASSRQRSQFSATWTQTRDLLYKELEYLKAKNAILQTFHSPEDVTFDARLKSDTRNPRAPGVVLTFEITCPPTERNCKLCRVGNARYVDAATRKPYHGSSKLAVWCSDPNPSPLKLSYPCDTFNHWKDNVRAIALALEALRKVDRYGIKKGSQYTGYKALPPADETARPSVSSGMSDMDAAQVIYQHTENFQSGRSVRDILDSAELMEAAYREAARRVHPDKGGSHDRMAKVNQAAQILRSRFKTAAA